MAPIPGDGLLGTATAVAEGGMGVHIPFLEMRNLEGSTKTRLNGSIDGCRWSGNSAVDRLPHRTLGR